MNNAGFGKTWENIEIIKLVTTERRRIYLVSEPNYHTTNSQRKKILKEILLPIEMKKKTLMNKPDFQ